MHTVCLCVCVCVRVCVFVRSLLVLSEERVCVCYYQQENRETDDGDEADDDNVANVVAVVVVVVTFLVFGLTMAKCVYVCVSRAVNDCKIRTAPTTPTTRQR